MKFLKNSTKLKDFTISPNPFERNLIVELGVVPNSDVIVKIYDINGKNVFQSVNFATSRLLIDTENSFDAGIYYYQVIFDGNTHSGKIIKI